MLANICVIVRKNHQLSHALQAVPHIIVFARKFIKFVLLSRFVDL